MSAWHPTQDKILTSLSDGVPRTSKQIAEATGLTRPSVWSALTKSWKLGLVLRSKEPVYISKKVFKGRKGYRQNTRGFYNYIISTTGSESLTHDGTRFVEYSDKHIDPRGARKESKSQKIFKYLEENTDSAYFSKDVFV